jgi:hypothetical protein
MGLDGEDVELSERRSAQGSGVLAVQPNEKSTSRLETDAPLCRKCMTRMKLLTLVPGREFNDVHYRCEECGEKALRSVPRGR